MLSCGYKAATVDKMAFQNGLWGEENLWTVLGKALGELYAYGVPVTRLIAMTFMGLMHLTAIVHFPLWW